MDKTVGLVNQEQLELFATTSQTRSRMRPLFRSPISLPEGEDEPPEWAVFDEELSGVKKRETRRDDGGLDLKLGGAARGGQLRKEGDITRFFRFLVLCFMLGGFAVWVYLLFTVTPPPDRGGADDLLAGLSGTNDFGLIGAFLNFREWCAEEFSNLTGILAFVILFGIAGFILNLFRRKRVGFYDRRRANTDPESSRAAPSFSTEPPANNGDQFASLRMNHTEKGVDLQERLRELVKLAKEQGHLTYNDFNEALPEGMADPDEMDQIFAQLRSMQVDIIEAS